MRPGLSFLALGAFLLAACDSPSDSGRRVPARVDVASGDLQQAVAGTELSAPLVVRVEDERGRPVSNQLVNFVVTAGGGTVFAGSALTDRDGEARERWTLGTVAGDTQKVEARAVEGGTGRPLIFATFRAVARADAPFVIERTSPEQITGTAGLPADSLAVRVKDRHGNVVPNAAVVWTVRTGGGSISPAQGATGADGIAKARWTLSARLDSAQVAEAAAGLSLRAEFRAFPLPGATRVVAVRGGGQVVPAGGGTLAQPLVARVVGPDGQPVAGAVVRWDVGGIGTVSPVQSATDAQGEVSAVWTLAGPRGTYFAQAIYGPLEARFEASILGAFPVSVQLLGAPGGTEVHGEIPVGASCAGCTRVTVQVGADGPVLEGLSVAGGVVSLAGVPAGPLTVTARAYDGVAVAATETRTVTVRAAPPLQVVARVPGYVLDFRPDRILYADTTLVTSSRYAIRRVSTGVDSLVGGSPTGGRAFLTPDGAIFNLGTAIVQRADGVETTVGTGSELRVNGSWAVWRSGQTLFRRDLAAGTNVTVANDVHSQHGSDGDAQHAVGADGDVAYRTAVGQVVRWRNGVATPAGAGSFPLTDGGVMPFQTGGATQVGVSVLDGGGTTVLTPQAPREVLGWVPYDVRAGWVGFLRLSETSSLSTDLWVRSPAGALRKVSPCVACLVRGMGENGEVGFTSGSWTYAWRPDGRLLQVANDSTRGYRYVWIGGEAYTLIHNTVSRVAF